MRTITELQEFLGDLTTDGKAGPKTRAAVEAVLSQTDEAQPIPQSPTINSSSNNWPREADAPSFYGHSDGSDQWENENLVVFPAPYTLYMDGQPVSRIRCHKKVKDSLERILTQVKEHFPTPEERRAIGVDQYDGCYNYRSVRGRSHLSMHAYGAAVDFDAEHNPLGATHGKMSPKVVAIFKAEGWRWGGDYSGRKDWMHFEACR